MWRPNFVYVLMYVYTLSIWYATEYYSRGSDLWVMGYVNPGINTCRVCMKLSFISSFILLVITYWYNFNPCIMFAWLKDDLLIVSLPTFFKSRYSLLICILKFAKVRSKAIFIFHIFSPSINMPDFRKFKYAYVINCVSVLSLLIIMHGSWKSCILLNTVLTLHDTS